MPKELKAKSRISRNDGWYVQRVGIIGVGLLGGALGQRLAGQGWEVLGHDPLWLNQAA